MAPLKGFLKPCRLSPNKQFSWSENGFIVFLGVILSKKMKFVEQNFDKGSRMQEKRRIAVLFNFAQQIPAYN
jgi:hypothetical protein